MITKPSWRHAGGCRKGADRFEARAKPDKKLHLALMKMGFSNREASGMSHAEALAYLDAYLDMIDPRLKRRKYLVKRT